MACGSDFSRPGSSSARLSLGAFARTPRAMMNGLIYVALGGAIGASCRHLLSVAILRSFGPDKAFGFVTPTLYANVFGSLCMGLLIGWLSLRASGGEALRLFLGVGILGGFTTFSAFSLDAILLLERRDYGAFAAYISSSVVLSLMAVFAGLFAARKLLSL